MITKSRVYILELFAQGSYAALTAFLAEDSSIKKFSGLGISFGYRFRNSSSLQDETNKVVPRRMKIIVGKNILFFIFIDFKDLKFIIKN